MRTLLLAATALALLPIAASAAAPVTQAMTCPIGGKAFDFTTGASYTTWGERPDGKPYGSAEFPTPLPECPDNGLVLYKDYEPAEVAKLEPLVSSEAYQALRQDVSYYRAYWLMKEMGVPAASRLLALQRAAWQVDGDQERRARYLTEFAEETAKLPAKPTDLNWIGMEGRAVNALRELGRFDEALTRLEKLPASALEAPAVAGAEGKAAETARVRTAWASFFKQLRLVIDRKDASPEPFELIPRRVWMERCISGKGLSESQQAHCTAQAAIVDEARAKAEAEAKALGQNRDKSGR
ncbi:MAG TPA: hypothetical protein VIA98_04790 [Allosphingosinicella sp.]